jgi:translocation and assembly module TamB
MTRARKILTIVAASLAGLALVVAIAGILVVQTDWFRHVVREKIVTSVEESTGGKVDVAWFTFDWRHLRAQVRGFVIHGLEPRTAAPLLRANLVQIDLKLLSPFRGFVDIDYLLIDTPQANLIVYPDGRTNIPTPKVQSKSHDKSGVESVVDLAIGRFDLRNGTVTYGDRQSKLNASGANLRAQLNYSLLPPRYTGEIDVNPLYVQSGSNPALNVNVKLPLTMEKDKITLTNAQLTTPQSRILVSGSVDRLVNPRTTAHVNAKLSLDEIKNAMGLTLALDTAHAPGYVTADISGSMDANRAQIQSAQVTLGRTGIEAAGTLKDSGHAASLQFRSTLALGEIGTLLRVSAHPEGTVSLNGNAALDANNQYKINAHLNARGVAIRQGTTRISGVSLDTAIDADPRGIQLSGIRLAALGGSFTGSAAVMNLAQFHMAGNLHNFDIAQVARAFMPKPPGYDGVISGPVQADGNIGDPSGTIARANLAIAPGAHGVPVSGHLGIDYDGRAGTVNLDHSRLALPHTTAELSGSLNRQIQIRLVSRNFADLQPVAAIPVTFSGGGAATLTATVTGSLSAPHVSGQVAVTNFAVSGRAFTRFTAALDGSPSAASIRNAMLTRGPLQAQFSASVGLHNWKPENYDLLQADLVVANADLRDVLALAGQTGVPATGALHANAHIGGTVGSPAGNADLNVDRGTLEGEPFDTFTARAVLSQTAIDLPTFSMVAGPSRLDATAHYQHAVNDLQRGTVTAHVTSSQVQLARFQSLVKDRPGLRGLLNLDAGVTASIAPSPSGTEFQLTAVNANLVARDLEMQGKTLGDFTLTASTVGSAVRYNVNSNFAGSTIEVSGQSLLAGDHQTSATASIANLPIDRVLAVAGRRDLPLKGTLAADVQLNGTLQNPQGNGTLTIANGSAYNEPFTRLQASLKYTGVLIDLTQFRVDDGPSNLEVSASFSHPAGDLQDGQLRVRARSNRIQISRIHTIADARPGLAGTVQLTADMSATLHRNAAAAFSSLNAQVTAQNLSMNNLRLGGLNASAESHGNAVAFTVNSDLAKARIHGSGHVDMASGYPMDAQLNFTGVTWSGLSPFLSSTAQPFDASLDGQVSVSGPAAQTDALRGSLQLTKLEAHSTPTAGRAPRVNFEMHNTGNIEVALAKSVVTVQSFRVTGPYTNLTIHGTASIKDSGQGSQPVNLHANGNVKLEALEAFSTDIFSSGAVTLNASVTGNTAQPVVNGRLQLQNASFHMLSLPNGLSNANGAINLNGTEAVIDNLSGQTGGGKVTLAGFVSYAAAEPHFRIQATASHVHVAYPNTVTTEADAHLTLTGAESRSLLSGNITVLSIAIHSHSDVGSMLTSAATPPSTSEASTGLMAGMRFDVRINTSPGVQFRSDLAQNLQADAELTLRGSPDNPGMLGRVAVNSGDLIFFGGAYTVDQGIVTFSNPNKIDPVLNVDLETTAQGVDVTINVSGPMDKLKLTYHSDPPLEFQQVVSLLAAGKTPTTDPIIASQQPPAPQQSLEQSGASAVLGQAVSPVSGRLQRLFGVSKLSIDPQIVGATSNNPQATLTLQQQVTHNITFTYIQDVTQSTPSAIRIEWTISPTYSVVAQRDIYGEFAVDLFYKKRFH